MLAERLKYPVPLILWIVFFCFSTSAALLFQKLLLPLVPSLHAGMGLLEGDSVLFHTVAVQLAEKIHSTGWSAWSFYPAQASTGNVALLGALYAAFGVDPSLIIPVNAAVHALGGVLIYQIARLIATGKTGRIAGIIGATMFVVFPSALNWYAQVHKDGFSIAGVLLVLWSWLWIREKRLNAKTTMTIITGTLGGMLLLIFVRPYNLVPLAAVLATVWFVLLFIDLRQIHLRWRKLVVYALSASFIFGGALWARTSGTEEQYTVAHNKTIVWKSSPFAPSALEAYVAIAARARASFINAGMDIKAGSFIDTDVQPDTLCGVVAYFPRAIQIALFAPFPTSWLDKLSATRLVSVFETLIWYMIAPGIVLALLYRRSSRMLIAIVFCTLFLYVYGFTIANVGTLYRIRYPYLFIFIVIGLVGWVEYYLRNRRRRIPVAKIELPSPAPPQTIQAAAISDTTHAGLVGAGVIVTTLTICTYAGLFLRDVILARWFGVGAELDAFFLATAIPTLIVAVVSAPLGTMIVPQFLVARTRYSDADAQGLVSKILLLYLMLIIFVAAVLLLSSPLILRFVAHDFSADKVALSQSLLVWMLPIMMMSGVVIIGNAMLNSLQRFAVPAMAQIVVPVMSIIALVALGDRFGVMSVIVGMLSGQLINLWIVATALSKSGYSLRPSWERTDVPLRAAFEQYLPLIAAALLVNLAVPLNIAMASTLVEGSAATLGLGNKIVFAATGLLATAVATVILPHFASYMARNRLLVARSELSFFLLAASVMTIPLALLLFESSEIIVRVAFNGGAFDDENVKEVARVMHFGIVQLPFFTVNLLILKFAIATHQAGRVMVASLFGLAVNAVLNVFLMQHSGAAGIALAASIATAASACLMLVMFNRLGHISWMSMGMLGLNWMLYMTLVICLWYHSYTGVFVTVFALLFLLYGQWNLLNRWQGHRE